MLPPVYANQIQLENKSGEAIMIQPVLQQHNRADVHAPQPFPLQPYGATTFVGVHQTNDGSSMSVVPVEQIQVATPTGARHVIDIRQYCNSVTDRLSLAVQVYNNNISISTN